MRLATKRAAFLVSAAVIVGLSGLAMARPLHHTRHHHRSVDTHAAASLPAGGLFTTSDTDQGRAIVPQNEAATRERPLTRREARAARVAPSRQARAAYAAAPSEPSLGLTGSSLVATARQYIGTNPTGRRSLWCGAFLDKVLRDSGYPGGGNLALAYAHYGHRVAGPQIGAIAVMGRRRGGHVGVVTGLDPNGNPIIVSGNHNRTVAESVYPRGRIIAYVMPGG